MSLLLNLIYWALILFMLLSILSFAMAHRVGEDTAAAFMIWMNRCVLTASAGGVLLLIGLEKRPPLYGPFESALYILLLVSLMAAWDLRGIKTGSRPTAAPERSGASLPSSFLKTQALTTLVGLVILGVQINEPRAFNPDFFMYADPFVGLFFNLRLAAAALLCRAGILMVYPNHVSLPFTVSGHGASAHDMTPRKSKIDSSGRKNADKRYGRTDIQKSARPQQNMKKGQDCHLSDIKANPAPSRKSTSDKARTMLLMGAMIFLCSEWCGSFWCLNWLGDPWRWSHGFFEAALVFILVMLHCHLPGVPAKHRAVRTLTGCLPGGMLIWMIFF